MNVSQFSPFRFLQTILILILFNSCAYFNNEIENVQISPVPVVINKFTPKILWKVCVGNGIGEFYSKLHPAWKDNVIYAADRFGIVKAINATNGEEKWKVDISQKSPFFFLKHYTCLLSSGITIHGKYIYIASERGKIYVLNRKDGSISLEKSLFNEILSCPVVAKGLILLHTTKGILLALNQQNGKIQWKLNLNSTPISLRGESNPTILSSINCGVVGSDNGYINVFKLKTGELIWKKYIAHLNSTNAMTALQDVDVTPVVVNNVIYAIAYNGYLTALNLYSGNIIWKRNIGSVKNFVVTSGRIYLVDQDDSIMALTAENGKTIWSQSHLLHRDLTMPVLLKHYVVVGDKEGYVYFISRVNGKLLSEKKINSSGFQTEPVIANNHLIIQSNNGIVYALVC